MKFIQDVLNGIFQMLLAGFSTLVETVVQIYRANAAAVIIILGILFFGLVYIVDALNYISEQLPVLLEKIASATMQGSQIPDELVQAFSVANHFVPLSEFFGCVVLIFSAWTLSVVIRAAKAWIPGLT